MPCSPRSVSAERTSSSLNGLMMAVTSFIAFPFASAALLGPLAFGTPRRSLGGAREQSQEPCQLPVQHCKSLKLHRKYQDRQPAAGRVACLRIRQNLLPARQRGTKAESRERVNPSCATEATSVPSRV